MKVLSLETASKIMGAMNDKEEEEAIELDFKSPEAAAKKGARSAA